ncbi:cell wall surface anchor family domain protein [Streptococcus pneumoniae 2070108]|nr:cell wall surface anchor family domain protein [Streptococcus pneumoniae 2070108]
MIPYELFAGDGMLTRLLLKASDKAPWSDNGDAKNPALSPLGENVKTKGQYFYQVALDGNVAGKENKRSLTSSEQMVLKLTALQSMSMVTKTVNQTWTTS